MHTPFFPSPRFLPGKILLGILIAVTAAGAAELKPDAIVKEMCRVADWQLATPSKHALHDWTQAPFFLGLHHLQQVSGDAKYAEALDGFGQQLSYGPGPRVTHADDHAVLQAWLLQAADDKDKAKQAPAIAQFEKIQQELADKPAASVTGGCFTWCWCDALFMSPPVWAQLSALTGDAKYLDWADKEWWTTTDVLYDPQHRLYYRDNNFFTKKTATGNKVFWARGNGWVIGGLVHMLDYLPADHPSRGKYLGLYQDMMGALLKLQNPDGLWRTSLLDPSDPQGESSGTAFFVYGMAWGLNRGLLHEESYRPAVIKGYEALVGNIQPSGMLGFVQKIGDAPAATSADSTEVYGSGAFLLAGSEIVRLLDPTKRRKNLASFDGVKLPDTFLPYQPRVFARHVAERADDFTWENDLVAFRTYGPALRSGPENSGIDCWFKRVPYPIIDKWYLEDAKKLPYGNVNKPYHDDQGEGYDVYKVGDTRGCGGISVWANGKLHNSETYIAQRVIENTPEKCVFELDFASTLDGKVLRETKRITLIMGVRLFQVDSKFTLDGKPAADLDVAIGLCPQVEGSTAIHSPNNGVMMLWEKFDGHGLGTAIVIDPAKVVEMIPHKDASGKAQALCLSRTDDQGAIRWFAGFGWEGQGQITTQDQWASYLQKFSSKYLKTPYADFSKDSSFKVHSLNPPVE
ncbi:MAG: glycoside hydrolase family 88 protein [Verrucomicrobiota bacterium]